MPSQGEIKSEKILVKEIFSRMWFRIPEYQRPYVWGADEIGELLDDLTFAMTEKPDFEYFLSCGIPGKVEGERYKKSPEMVKEIMKQMPEFKAPARYIVFKRWDRLEDSDNPEVVIFFGKADVLSGLFTLANFDEIEPNGVIAPFCSGCASIVYYPYL